MALLLPTVTTQPLCPVKLSFATSRFVRGYVEFDYSEYTDKAIAILQRHTHLYDIVPTIEDDLCTIETRLPCTIHTSDWNFVNRVEIITNYPLVSINGRDAKNYLVFPHVYYIYRKSRKSAKYEIVGRVGTIMRVSQYGHTMVKYCFAGEARNPISSGNHRPSRIL